MGKKVYESTETIINEQTGEVIQTKNVQTRRVRAERFMQVYIKDISSLYSLNETHLKVLMELWSLSKFNTNEVFLSKTRKDDIAKRIKKSLSGVNNSISQLCKRGLLLRRARQEYILNPKIFFKGEQIKRGKVIEVFTSYKIK